MSLLRYFRIVHIGPFLVYSSHLGQLYGRVHLCALLVIKISSYESYERDIKICLYSSPKNINNGLAYSPAASV